KGDWYDKGVWLGPNDLFTSRELLWKNAARMLAYGYGGWWFDMWGGWFSDPEMLEIFNTSQQLYRESIGQTQNAVYHPEVAVVVDEKLQFADDTYGRITGSILANRYRSEERRVGKESSCRTAAEVEKAKDRVNVTRRNRHRNA